jgi:hypothetical protein
MSQEMPSSQELNQSVRTLLETLQREYPGYTSSDRDEARSEMMAAGIALACLVGNVGAWVLYRGDQNSLGKFLTMVTRSAEQMAHEGASVIREKRSNDRRN